MRPNFEKLTNRELREYAIAHRGDKDIDEVLDILYSRRTPDSEATIYPCMFTEEGLPIEENIHIAKEAIRKRIEAENNKKKDPHS